MVHLHNLFLLRLSVLKIGPKKRTLSKLILLHPSLNDFISWGKPTGKFLINIKCLSQQKWRDLVQPFRGYRHMVTESAHSVGGNHRHSHIKSNHHIFQQFCPVEGCGNFFSLATRPWQVHANFFKPRHMPGDAGDGSSFIP